MTMLLWQIFWIFTKVALLSWGGGPASLALMQSEAVEVGFVTRAEFADAVALGNVLPGPIAPKAACYIGYKRAGVWGGIVAALGTIGPTTALMFIMILVFFSVKDSPHVHAMLQAVRPAVVGLLAWTAYEMGSSVLRVQGQHWTVLSEHWDKLLIILVTFVVTTGLKLNPAFIVLGAALLGLCIYR